MPTNPNTDPPVDEIREIRRKISAEVDHDPQRLVEYYIEMQKKTMDYRMIDNRQPGAELEKNVSE